MGDQWWDGWIGALLAAAVTVGATVWWDARVRRRERLEEAAARLHEAATNFGMATQRMRHGLGGEELGGAYLAMGNAILLVQGLALRRVLLLPAKVAGPARFGLAATVEWLSDRLRDASSAVDEDGRPEQPEVIVQACRAVSVVCLLWLSNPMAFWPGRRRGPEYFEMAHRSEN